MAAAIDLISRSMRRAGILASGETPPADETMDALSVLNGILEQWSIDGLSVFVRRELVFTGNGQPSFTVGPAGDVISDRPDMINSIFVRSGGIDYPVELIGDGNFSGIGDKASQGRPLQARYWPSIPEGRIDLWPVPDSSYTVHLLVNSPLERVEAPADDINLAPGYDRALLLTLAVDLCVEFQRSIPTGLPDLMMEAVASIKRRNINNQPEKALFDPFFSGRGLSDFMSG